MAILTSLFAGKVELAVLFCLLALILWVTLYLHEGNHEPSEEQRQLRVRE